MNNLNTLLVNEQLIRLKGETLSFAKVQQQHNAGCKHRFTTERLKKNGVLVQKAVMWVLKC